MNGEREAVVAEAAAAWLDRHDVSENRAADEVRERSAEVGAAVLAALDAATRAQDGADPADGLSHAEKELLRPILARYARWFGAHDGPVFEAVEAILFDRLARQRPTQQAATDRVVEAVEALAVCDETHGADHNETTVYGHHASRRVCIRLHGTDTWVYDPRWETTP